MINRRFFNFKTYDNFLANRRYIPEDAIVFIQDKLRIWAHGAEYVCDGSNTSSITSGVLVFKDAKDDTVFTITLNGGTLTLTDSEGNASSATYITSNDLLPYTLKADLHNIAFSGSYRDLKDKPTLDTSVYVIVNQLGDPSEASPDKIYILETRIDDTYTYESYGVKNNQWVKLGSVAPSITISGYLTSEEARLTYATKQYVDDTFVRKSEVYHPRLGEWGTDDTSSGGNDIIISPSNPTLQVIVNQVVDIDAVSEEQFTEALSGKQDVLTPGNGISIINNVISTTLDTSVFTFVQELPTTSINANKIYILEHIDGDQRTYTQHKYINNAWVTIGDVAPEIDLSSYTTFADVASSYQPKGSYVSTDQLNRLILDINRQYQRRGYYVNASDVTNALTALLLIIDLKYVLKKDVYNPEHADFNSSEPATINVGSSNGQEEATGGYNMITLSTALYDSLVRQNLVDSNTYYFTYEETNSWTFGGTFPITLS